jgi:hypothetical protein
MSTSELEKLLGRSLTSRESTGCAKYLEVARQLLEEITCVSLQQEAGERIFESRDGYKTLFVGIFSEITSVTVDGELIDASEYTIKFFDDRNKGFYNSIVFEEAVEGEEVVVDAQWGFNNVPSDLNMVLAQLFAYASQKKTLGSVKSKRVEDFHITYGDNTDFQELVADNAIIINKYTMCDIYDTRHGDVNTHDYI